MVDLKMKRFLPLLSQFDMLRRGRMEEINDSFRILGDKEHVE